MVAPKYQVVSEITEVVKTASGVEFIYIPIVEIGNGYYKVADQGRPDPWDPWEEVEVVEMFIEEISEEDFYPFWYFTALRSTYFFLFLN